MARPQKQIVDYFPHDCTQQTTMFIIESKFGNDGYTFWFKLLELLGNTPGHFIDCRNNGTWEFLQAKTKLNGDTTEDILGLLAKLDAIDAALWGERIIWCQNFVNRISEVYKNRRVEIPQKPTFPSCSNGSTDVISTTDNPNHTIVSTPNLQGITDKLKETKLNNTKVLYMLVFDFWNTKEIIKHQECSGEIKRAIEAKLKQYTQEEICKAIENYTEILHGEEYFWSFKWTLKDFLKRGIDKFLDSNVARQNYKIDSKATGKGQKEERSPAKYRKVDPDNE